MLLITLVAAAGTDRLGHGFRATYLPAAHSVWAGHSPMADPTSPLVDDGEAYVYPRCSRSFSSPSPRSGWTSRPSWRSFCRLRPSSPRCVSLASAVCGCYAALLLWAPAFNALEMANVSAGLALLAALAWRYRESLWPCAWSVALALAVKLFLWPLVVWMVATRHFRAAAVSAALAIALVVTSWALIGFADLMTFPDLLRANTGRERYSLPGIAYALGLGWGTGRALAVLVGGAFLFASVVLGRRDDMRRSCGRLRRRSC